MSDSKAALLAEAYKRDILPAEQKAAYEEAIRRGLVDGGENKPVDMAREVGAIGSGGVRGAAGILGAPVDLVNSAIALAQSDGTNGRAPLIPGLGPLARLLPAPSAAPVGGSEWWKDRAGNVVDLGNSAIGNGPNVAGTPTGREIIDQQAETRIGRLGARAMEEVTANALPMMGAMRMGAGVARATPSMRGSLVDAVGGTGRGDRIAQTVASAGAGLGAGVAQEVAPGSAFAEFAGGLLGGVGTGMGMYGAGSLRNLVAPAVSEGARRDIAGQTLRQFATDPNSIMAPSPDIVPGSPLTTAQAAMDPGLAGLERTLRSQTETGPLFAVRDAERAQAQRTAAQGLAPEGGGAEDVAAMVQQRLGQFQRRGDVRETLAQNAVEQQVGALGPGADAVTAGGTIRSELAGARTQAKAGESRQWNALQQNEDLALEVGSARDAGRSMLGEIGPYAAPPQGDTAAILEAAAGLPDVLRYSDLQQLRSRALQASSDLKRAGNAVDARRVDAVVRGLDDDIARAAAGGDETPGGPSAPSPGPRPDGPAGAGPSGNGTVYTPGGMRVDTDWRLVDLAAPDAPIVSHTPDFRPNPAFPADLQPRDRGRTASARQVTEIAGKLNPERLGAGGVGDGAPIVGPDGITESGNGRLMAIDRAYRNGGQQAAGYRAWVEAQGFDTAGMQKPALVRVRTNQFSPAERVRFAEEANTGPGLRQSAVEQAAQDAGRVGDDVLNLYRGGSLDDPANTDFARAFVGSMPGGDANALATRGGTLSTEGLRRMQSALLAKVFGGETPLVNTLLETDDDSIRSLGRALTDAAPALAQLKAAIARGDVPGDFDPTAPLLDAARVAQRARTGGVPIGDVLAQADAFNPVHPLTEQFLRAAYGDNLSRISRGRAAEALRTYTADAMQQSGGGGLFGPGPNAADVWAAARRRVSGVAEETAAPAASLPPGGIVEITREQRRQMLAAQGDVYADSGAPKSERVGRNGETFMAYDYSPEYFLRSDLTGRPIRHYVRLPDGRIAHPDELFTSDRVMMAKEPNPQAEAKAAWRDAIKNDFLYTPAELGRMSEGAGVPVKEIAQIRREHRMRVAKAIEDGRQIPPAVLDLYPDLKARAAELEPKPAAGVSRDAQSAGSGGSGVPPGGGGAPPAAPPSAGGGSGRGGGGQVIGDGLTPNFGPEEAAAYRAARNATAERKQTFDRGAVGQALQQGGYNARDGVYAMPVEQVAARFFNAGRASATDMAEFLRAAESRPAAVQALTDYAVGDLRRAAVDAAGRVDPKRWAAWVAKHTDALKPFPEVRAQFATVEKAQRVADRLREVRGDAVKRFEKSAAGKFMDRDAEAAFSAVIKSGDRTRGLTQLVRIAKGDEVKLGQLRRAAVDHMLRTVENTGSVDALGNQSLSPAKTVGFMRDNAKPLQKSGLLSPGQLAVLRKVEEDMQRAVYVQTVGKAVGSPTYQNMAAGAVLGQLTMGFAGRQGPTMNLLANTIGRFGNWMYKMPDAQIRQLVADAMLDPALARDLVARGTPERMQWLVEALRRRALATGLTTAVTADGEP